MIALEQLELLADPIFVRTVIVITMASTVGGLVSLLVRYSQSQFLAIESLHMILAAGTAGYFTALFLPLSPEVLTYLFLLLLMGLAALLEQRRVEKETSIAALAFVAAAGASYFSSGLAELSPLGTAAVYSLLFGTPFFIPERELPFLAAAGGTILLLLAFSWKRLMLLSFDPEYFSFIKGPRSLFLHRLFLYALLAAAAVYLTRITGAVAAHVLLVAPAMVPLKNPSPAKALGYAMAVSYSSLLLSLLLNLPFGASLGFLAIIAYLLPNLARR
ncbi:MAG: metal ABC transporter permease [Acidilobaceae archaeon]